MSSSPKGTRGVQSLIEIFLERLRRPAATGEVKYETIDQMRTVPKIAIPDAYLEMDHSHKFVIGMCRWLLMLCLRPIYLACLNTTSLQITPPFR